MHMWGEGGGGRGSGIDGCRNDGGRWGWGEVERAREREREREKSELAVDF